MPALEHRHNTEDSYDIIGDPIISTATTILLCICNIHPVLRLNLLNTGLSNAYRDPYPLLQHVIILTKHSPKASDDN